MKRRPSVSDSDGDFSGRERSSAGTAIAPRDLRVPCGSRITFEELEDGTTVARARKKTQ